MFILCVEEVDLVLSDHCLWVLCCTVHPLLVCPHLSFKPREHCLHVHCAQCGAQATLLSKEHNMFV